jgi:integrase
LAEKYLPALQLMERGGLTISETQRVSWPEPGRRRILVRGTKRDARVRWVDDTGDAHDGHGALLEGLEPGFLVPPQRAIGSAIEAAIRKTGVPVFSPHDLRHLHASRMLHAGMSPAELAARMGHANTHTLLRVYTHVVPPD